MAVMGPPGVSEGKRPGAISRLRFILEPALYFFLPATTDGRPLPRISPPPVPPPPPRVVDGVVDWDGVREWPDLRTGFFVRPKSGGI